MSKSSFLRNSCPGSHPGWAVAHGLCLPRLFPPSPSLPFLGFHVGKLWPVPRYRHSRQQGFQGRALEVQWIMLMVSACGATFSWLPLEMVDPRVLPPPPQTSKIQNKRSFQSAVCLSLVSLLDSILTAAMEGFFPSPAGGWVTSAPRKMTGCWNTGGLIRREGDVTKRLLRTGSMPIFTCSSALLWSTSRSLDNIVGFFLKPYLREAIYAQASHAEQN